MMSAPQTKEMGQPAIAFGGLAIWIHGRQFPGAKDYWDGNWLRATVRCNDVGSSVSAHGAIIHLGEVAQWLGEIEKLHQNLEGKATLACVEPNLHVDLRPKGLGHISVVIDITPNQITQSHQFRDEVDQTMLPPLISPCREVLQKYPLRDPDKFALKSQ